MSATSSRLVLLIGAAMLALAGCTSGISSVPTPATASVPASLPASVPAAAPSPSEAITPIVFDSAQVTFAIAIPSPIAGVTGVTLSGGLLNYPAKTASGPCTSSGCSLTASVNVGPSAFTVSLTGANNVVLNGGTFARYILDTSDTLGLSFGGAVASIRLSVDPTQLTTGTAGTTQLTLMAFDAAGNRIIGQTPLATPITVTASDNQSLLTMSGTSFATADQRITLSCTSCASGGVVYTPALAGVASGRTAGLSIVPGKDDEMIAGRMETLGGALAESAEMEIAFETGRSIKGVLRRTTFATLPAQFSLASSMPVPGPQGSSSSCSGWAAGYAMMSKIVANRAGLKQFAFPQDPNQVSSPSFIYNQINGGKDVGAYMSDALNLIRARGAPSWTVFPFSASDFLTQPNASVLQVAAASKISDWAEVPPGVAALTTVKASIFAGVPVIFRILAESTLQNLQAGQIWTNPATGPTSGTGHFMALIGWDDSQNAFLMYNSWDSTWANGGIGLISYNGLMTGYGTYAYIVTP